jgi:ABC-type antimicrobial peptide transport system permease subunit
MKQYGVTDVDYAVQIGDELITGNSRPFIIKDITSYEGIIKTQIIPISKSSRNFSLGGLIIVSLIVGVLLAIITSNDVRRQRQRLGIMKGLGYSSKDLMKQISLKHLLHFLQRKLKSLPQTQLLQQLRLMLFHLWKQ